MERHIILASASFYDGENVSASEIINSLDKSIVSMKYIEIFALNNKKNKLIIENYSEAMELMKEI